MRGPIIVPAQPIDLGGDESLVFTPRASSLTGVDFCHSFAHYLLIEWGRGRVVGVLRILPTGPSQEEGVKSLRESLTT